jgi:hypothetical protein
MYARRLLDFAVIVVCVSILAFAVTGIYLTQTCPPETRQRVLDEFSLRFGMPVGLAFGGVSPAWLIWGRGVESPLWSWLPPLVVFRGYGRTGRLVVIWAWSVLGLASPLCLLWR